MYCECFANGRTCDATCGCTNCFNSEQHQELILKSKSGIMKRNPEAFVKKVESKISDEKSDAE